MEERHKSPVDDSKARGHNADSENTATHRPADLDMFATMARTLAELLPHMPIAWVPSNFKSAHWQVPSEPAQALDFVIALWDVEFECQVFLFATAHLLAAENAPFNFTPFARILSPSPHSSNKP